MAAHQTLPLKETNVELIMWMKLNKFTALFILSFILISEAGICSEKNDTKNAIEKGYVLVETFYSCLSSNKLTNKCKNIFDLLPHGPKDQPIKMWEYLRRNKELFFVPTHTIKDENFFNWSKKSVTFFNPKNLEDLNSGLLYITLVSTLPKRSYPGIYKEISFPIVKDMETTEYKIDFFCIKINGIIIDNGDYFIRDFDILEALGFKSTVPCCQTKK
jgi:hypothetical protein